MPGLVVKSNAEMMAEEQAEAQDRADSIQNQPVILGLSAFVRSCWDAARDAKAANIDPRLLSCMRACNGEYPPDKLTAIRAQGGSEIFMMLTDEKCTMAESWFEEILLPSDDQAFGLKNSADPEIPDEEKQAIDQHVKQQAIAEGRKEALLGIQAGQFQSADEAQQFMMQTIQNRVQELAQTIKQEIRDKAKEELKTLERAIQDEVEESGWEDALKDAIPDIVRMPAGFVKGPVVRNKRVMAWNGKEATTEKKLALTWSSPSPWDIYPSPTSTCVDDGYLIERHRLGRADLQALIGVEDYDEEAIREVLRESGNGGLQDWLYEGCQTQRAQLEGRLQEDRSPERPIDALQFWGNVQGVKLLEYGMDPEMVQDPVADYPVEIWLIGRWVIKCTFNPDPLGRKPYYMAGFRNRKGSFWKVGLPEVIKDSQEQCNAAARNLANNMGISSGPQVGVDVSQLAPGEDITSLYPWKIWQMDRSRGGSPSGSGATPPVWFFQPNPFIAELLKVYEFYSGEADSKSGIPKYAYGSNKGSGGALSTATGFSMMMNNATRGIKGVVRGIDYGIISPSIQHLVEWLQLFRPEELLGYAGDIRIFARGSSALIAKEQQAVRRNEALQVVMNPLVLQIVGADGFASLLRQIFTGLDIRDVVPSEEEMAYKQRTEGYMQQIVQSAQQMHGQGQLPQGQQTNQAGASASGQDHSVAQGGM